MRLPDGVSYHPREQALIAKDRPALVRISTTSYPNNNRYDIRERSFDKDIARYLYADWEELHRLFGLNTDGVVYSGAQHPGPNSAAGGLPKLPNITVLPNRRLLESRGLGRPLTVFGCTMGHHHPAEDAGTRVQELYEFQSHGMLVIDREDSSPELWVARDGDKVAVPNACHMTLYNLGDADHPLVTLDFANPDRNDASKELIGRCGPILVGYYDDFEVTLCLSPLYVASDVHSAGVRPGRSPLTADERRVVVQRGTRLDLGTFVYEQLTNNPEVIGQLARMGLRVRRASPAAVLEPLSAHTGGGRCLHLASPLAEITKTAADAYRFFFPKTPAAAPASAIGGGLTAAAARMAARREEIVKLDALDRKMQVLVEGAGDWVEKTFRPIFAKRSDHVSVYYADDTRWTGRPPSWVSALEPWEVYLDKADPLQFERHHLLRSSMDVVFVVTPDFTHSDVARQAIDYVPGVFVEKPFDSQTEHVVALLQEMGAARRTFVLGLDHYRAYAGAIQQLMPAIDQHLGGALASAVFTMAEDQPIEYGRDRSLQHGLTLDMLPHFLALLTWFGDVATIDEIRVLEAGQYRPLIARDPSGHHADVDIGATFRNETASKVLFSFRDYSGNGHRVTCKALVGKGFGSGARYLEIAGRSGASVRVDFNRRPQGVDRCPGYPWDSLFFISKGNVAGTKVDKVSDPYNPSQTLHILAHPRASNDRERYGSLLEDLIHGRGSAAGGTLLITEARAIVDALDRIWHAIQNSRPWLTYELDGKQPSI